MLVGLVVPWLFYVLRKPSWRRPADPAAAQDVAGEVAS